MKWNLRISAAALCLFATCARAAEPGFYLTASLGKAEEDPRSAGTNFANSQVIFRAFPDQVAVDAGKLAWSAGLGYRINRYLAGELEYVDFGTTRVSEHYTITDAAAPFPFPSEFTLDYSSHVTGPLVSVLGTLPVGENFEVFVRGGALFASREFQFAFGTLDNKFASTVWVAGGGVNWSLAKRWAIRAEFQQTGELSKSFASGETSLQRLSLTALFKL